MGQLSSFQRCIAAIVIFAVYFTTLFLYPKLGTIMVALLFLGLSFCVAITGFNAKLGLKSVGSWLLSFVLLLFAYQIAIVSNNDAFPTNQPNWLILLSSVPIYYFNFHAREDGKVMKFLMKNDFAITCSFFIFCVVCGSVYNGFPYLAKLVA